MLAEADGVEFDGVGGAEETSAAGSLSEGPAVLAGETSSATESVVDDVHPLTKNVTATVVGTKYRRTSPIASTNHLLLLVTAAQRRTVIGPDTPLEVIRDPPNQDGVITGVLLE